MLFSISIVDRRSTFDAPNLVGIFLNVSDEGFYEMGTSTGKLDRQYICTLFDLYHCLTISTVDIPSQTVALRGAALHLPLGKDKMFLLL